MGARASEYAATAPHNSYVHVEEFTSPEDLASYLQRLDEDDALYNSYFKWKVSTPQTIESVPRPTYYSHLTLSSNRCT